ncbi:MAG: hypothetical protein NTW94_01840 [Legionellales bacterium]|nr:hypothetical protein [Legionellales bacterium]
MEKIQSCGSGDEVVLQLTQFLNERSTQEKYIFPHYMFVPENTSDAPQLGYLEKMAHGKPGSLANEEPLTTIDIMRTLYSYSVSRAEKKTYKIFQRQHLETGCLNATVREPFDACWINLNEDLTKPAKWGVLKNGLPHLFYCEMSLSPAEKKLLRNKFGTITFQPSANTKNFNATGYSALAWFDVNVQNRFGMTMEQGFDDLRKGFISAQFRGDLNSSYLTYTFKPKEYESFGSSGFQQALYLTHSGPDSSGWIGGAYSAVLIPAVLAIGEHSTETLPDVCTAIEHFSRYPVASKVDNDPIVAEYQRFSLYGLIDVLKQYPVGSGSRKMLTIHATGSKLELNLPDSLNEDDFWSIFEAKLDLKRWDPNYKEIIKKKHEDDPEPDKHRYLYLMILLNTVYQCIKIKTMVLTLPITLSLTKDEQALLGRFLEQNKSLTSLQIIGNVDTAKALSTGSAPLLAMNRWLAMCNHNASCIEDSWEWAAYYWLVKLHDMDLTEAGVKENFRDMGILGLNAIIKALKNPPIKEIIDATYGEHQPTFYLSCRKEESFTVYLTALANYLGEESDFPYQALEIDFQSGDQIDDFLHLPEDLLTKLFATRRFDPIKLNAEGREDEIINLFAKIGSKSLLDLKNTSEKLHEYDNERLKSFHKTFEDELATTGADLSNTLSKLQKQFRHNLAELNFAEISSAVTDGTQLELDLDQELQHQQEQQLEHEHEQELQLDPDEEFDPHAAITETQFDLSNIDELVPLYKSLEKITEGEIDKNYSTTGDDAGFLQNFFRQWVDIFLDDPPQAPYPPHAIRKITRSAAEILLKHRQQVYTGLSLDNLPQGFYTQRDEDNHLILCYDPKCVHKKGNPFRLSFATHIPKAKHWLGDHNILPDLTAEEFAFLQPDSKTLIEPSILCPKLLPENARGTPNLWDWMQHIPNKEHRAKILKALGQLYYAFGSVGVLQFLKALEDLRTTKPEAFDHFKQNVLLRMDNFSSLLNVKNMDVIKKMSSMNPDDLVVWQAIYAQHFQAAGVEHLATLWRAYEFFCASLTELGLNAKTVPFDTCTDPKNMFILMDRILICLRHLPKTQRKTFLDTLGTLDMKHGGIFYAIRYEGFKTIDPELQLLNFMKSEPTYAPALHTIEQWKTNEDDLFPLIQRALALNVNLQDNKPGRDKLLNHLNSFKKASDKNDPRMRLIWLLRLKFDAQTFDPTSLMAIPKALHDLIAKHLQQIAGTQEKYKPTIRLEAVKGLAEYVQRHHFSNDRLQRLLQAYPNGTVLECISMIHQLSTPVQDENLRQALECFEASKDLKPRLLPLHQVASLFHHLNLPAIRELHDLCPMDTKPAVITHYRKLMEHLLSLDLDSSSESLKVLKEEATWKEVMKSLQMIKKDPWHAKQYHEDIIEYLNKKDLHFQLGSHGYRSLLDKDKAQAKFDAFPEYEDRLWNVFKKHLVLEDSQEVGESFAPIIEFIKKLAKGTSLINELDAFIRALESLKDGYWSMDYLQGLLTTLQGGDEKMPFPLSVFTDLICHETLAPSSTLRTVKPTFPASYTNMMQPVLNSTNLNRKQQGLLCHIGLQELDFRAGDYTGDDPPIFTAIKKIVEVEDRDPQVRTLLLSMMEKEKNIADMATQLSQCTRILNHAAKNNAELKGSWPKTESLYFQALNREPPLAFLKDNLLFIETNCSDPTSQGMILHIFAHSCLKPALADQKVNARRIAQIIDQLRMLKPEELKHLATLYPDPPSPNIDDLRRFFKEKDKHKLTWSSCLQNFKNKATKALRQDYGKINLIRETDFQRMLEETVLQRGAVKTKLSIEQKIRLSAMLSHLKGLENKGELRKATDDELRIKYQDLCQEASQSSSQANHSRAELWAVLFEVLARKTGKYPHLAQQFALIANDLGVTVNKRILKLATGEGKSHFVALRAAYHAGLGKKVNIATAKRALSKRDKEDYHSFFNALGIKTAQITTNSQPEDYNNSQIRYGILGDFSIFLDQSQKKEPPIEINRDNTVLLLDEFDFVRFDEGLNTQYNYAVEQDKTPGSIAAKKWFYNIVYDFYITNQTVLNKTEIPNDLLTALFQLLLEQAGDDPARRTLLIQLAGDPKDLIKWVVATRSAFAYKIDVEYTVKSKKMTRLREQYDVREIIPLSKDNQPLEGSSFRAGVHQMLGVHLNKQELKEGRPQNFIVRPEGKVLSSQVAAFRIQQLHKIIEGFTGSLTDQQAVQLEDEKGASKENGTAIVNVPTNARDLRKWPDPEFFDTPDARFVKMLENLKNCLDNNQSFLFACKNDAEVVTLKERLLAAYKAGNLSDQHFEKLIFYTNADTKTSTEILQEKHTKEKWHLGHKQTAIGLVASCFGRGDNVEVEAVFLFDVNDRNDQLQKGGRTARNGAEGSVFQYYLSEEIIKDETTLRDELTRLNIDLSPLGRVDDIPPHQRFKNVMQLRACKAQLETELQEYYHYLIAQFSDWAMRTALEEDKIATAQELFVKEWKTRGSGGQLKTKEEKRKIADDLLNIMQVETNQLADLLIPKPSLTEFKVFSPREPKLYTETSLTLTESEKAIHQILNIGLQFDEFSKDDQLIDRLVDKLVSLQENPNALYTLLAAVRPAKTITAFYNILKREAAVVALIDLESRPAPQLELHQRLAKECAIPETAAEQFTQNLKSISEKFPAHANKILSQLLSLGQTPEFIQHVIQTFAKWDQDEIATFTTLFHATQTWLEKAREQSFSINYPEQLRKLWGKLAQSDPLENKVDFIKWALDLEGKSWFIVLNHALTHPEVDLQSHLDELKAWWANDVASYKDKNKSARHARFKSKMTELSKPLPSQSANSSVEEVIQSMPRPHPETLLTLSEAIMVLENLDPITAPQLELYEKLAIKCQIPATAAAKLAFLLNLESISKKFPTDTILEELLHLDQTPEFIQHVIQTFAKWDQAKIATFRDLFNATQEDQYFSIQLRKIWGKLAQSDLLENKVDFIKWALELKDQSRFIVINLALTYPKMNLQMHLNQLKEWWTNDNTEFPTLGLHEARHDRFHQFIQKLNRLSPDHIQTISKLSFDHLKQVLQFAEDHQQILSTYPKLWDIFLSLVTSSKSGDALKNLGVVLSKIQEIMAPQMNTEHRIKALTHFMEGIPPSKTPINPRAILMSIMNDKLLVSDAAVWSDDDNRQALSTLFGIYLNQTSRLLSAKPVGLDRQQQQSLLLLTQELLLVGTSFSNDHEGSAHFKQSIEKYQNKLNFWVSDHAKDTLKQVREATTDVQTHSEIIKSIHSARKEAFKHSIQMNKGQWNFWGDRQGNLHKTLHKMEHDVAQHWVTKGTHYGFYQDQFQTSMEELKALLIEELKKQPKLPLWKQKLQNLKDSLKKYPLIYNRLSSPTNFDSVIEKINVWDIDLKLLPNYLKPLAQEIILQKQLIDATDQYKEELPQNLKKPSES